MGRLRVSAESVYWVPDKTGGRSRIYTLVKNYATVRRIRGHKKKFVLQICFQKKKSKIFLEFPDLDTKERASNSLNRAWTDYKNEHKDDAEDELEDESEDDAEDESEDDEEDDEEDESEDDEEDESEDDEEDDAEDDAEDREHVQKLCDMAADSEFSDSSMDLESDGESVETQAAAEQRMLKNILERRKDEGKLFMICEGRVNPVTGEPDVILVPAHHVNQDLHEMRLREKKLVGDMEAEKNKVADLNARLDAAKKKQSDLETQLAARDLAFMQRNDDHKKLQDVHKKKGSEYRMFTERMKKLHDDHKKLQDDHKKLQDEYNGTAAEYKKVLYEKAELLLQQAKDKINFQVQLIEAHEDGARYAVNYLFRGVNEFSEDNKPKVSALKRREQEMSMESL